MEDIKKVGKTGGSGACGILRARHPALIIGLVLV
jgi:hypothetical protein